MVLPACDVLWSAFEMVKRTSVLRVNFCNVASLGLNGLLKNAEMRGTLDYERILANKKIVFICSGIFIITYVC